MSVPGIIKGNEDARWIHNFLIHLKPILAFHAVHTEQLNPGNIVIKGYDIDIFIIMLSNTQKFSQTDAWLDMRLDYSKSHTFINVTGTADKMNSIQVLPGVCTFIGCNYLFEARSFYQLLQKLGETRLDWWGYWCNRTLYMLYVWLQQGNKCKWGKVSTF